MKCKECGKDTKVRDTRVLTTKDNICFVRRVRYCCKQAITHEVYVEDSPIPDIYRMKRIRKPTPKKTKPKNKNQWLKNIMLKLDS